MATLPVMTDGGDGGGGRAKPKRPRQTYKPTQEEIDVALERGKKSEAAAKQAKIRSLVAGLTEPQMEGLRLGENFVGWDSEKKEAYYGTPQATLKPGRNRIAEIQGRSTAFRPQRVVSEDLATIGIPGMGMAGVIGIGAKKGGLITSRMAKELNQLDELKTLDDLPEAFTAQQVSDRSRKLFGKNPAQLTKQEEAVVWIDLVDNAQRGKRTFAPSPKVKGPRQAERRQAAEKLAQAQRQTERAEEGAGIAATLGKEARSAEAAGTTTVEVGGQAARTGGRRGAQRTGQTRTAARAGETATEGRAVKEELRQAVTRQADEAAPRPSMAGQTRSAEDIAEQSAKQQSKAATRKRKAETKAAKNADRDLNKIAKQKLPNEVDEAFVRNLEQQIETAAQTGTPAKVEAARETLTRAQNKLTNQTQKAAGQARRAKEAAEAKNLQQAAERRAAAKSAEPDDVAAAQATFDEWAALPDSVVRKKQIGKRAAELAKKPWDEMTGIERRNFIAQAAKERPIRPKSKPASKPAAEATEEVVEEAAERVPFTERLERGAKTVGKAALTGGVGAGVGGTMAGPVGAGIGAVGAPIAREAFRRAPTATVLTGLGTTAALKADDIAEDYLEGQEADILARTTQRTQARRSEMAGQEKLRRAEAQRIATLREKQWHGVPVQFDDDGNPQSWPDNWEVTYENIADVVPASETTLFRKNMRIKDPVRKRKAMAKHMRQLAGGLINAGYDNVLAIEYDDEGNPATEIDVDAIRAIWSQ